MDHIYASCYQTAGEEVIYVDNFFERQPDITQARERLGWQPSVPLAEGLERTIPYFADLLSSEN